MNRAEMKEPLRLEDGVGRLAGNIREKWLIGLRESNPAILDMFHERDRKPYRDLLPWSGEFAGKYVTGAYYIYQLGRSQDLYQYMLGFLDELLTCIDEDGYAGCYQRQCRLTGAFSQTPEKTGETWDAWSHYHIMFGLFLWYRETGDARYLEAVERIAGLFLRSFYRNGRRLAHIGSTEMNLAPIHIFALLYQETGKPEYLDFAREIEEDLTLPEAGDYIRHSQAGLEFYQCPKPRWESLHVIMGLAALYDAVGEEKYRRAAEQIFYSILKTDIHNTGAFSTNEQAVGTPFSSGSIELCCVIAYNALACEILKWTKDPRIPDFLELSLYNAVMGSFSPSGSWSTYSTPMDGEKKASRHDIVFQGRPGSPDLNCCSANSARGVGMVSEWAVMEEEDTLYLNYYGDFSCETKSGVEIRVGGGYPANSTVTVRLKSQGVRRAAFRIPAWSAHTTVQDGGESFPVEAGGYWVAERQWNGGELKISFDFTPRTLRGEGECAGKLSVYAGPVLYGYDLSLGCPCSLEEVPAVASPVQAQAAPEPGPRGRLLLRLEGGLTLCDFYHLGMTGSAYRTWLPCREEA